ncbi:sensor histidine kinase [Streptomyces mesophilus]|uniref:sensor histidine kinase n=1 Tax=Streptomyces mesophilus TaxID=1775132 RepID=UPI0033302083
MTWPSLRPHRDDVLIAVGGLLSGLLLWSLHLDTHPGQGLDDRRLTLIPLAAMSALALLRRALPRAAFGLGFLVLVMDQFVTGSLVTLMLFTDLVYAAVVYGPPSAVRRIPILTGLISVASMVALVAWYHDAQAFLLGLIIAAVIFGPAMTGVTVRLWRDRADTAVLRAEQTALLAEMDRTQAVTAERARMARELHDMVANHLSAIAIHSTAALSLDDAKTTREALTVIRENSVEGLAEMRRLIGILRDDSGDLEPAAAPTLDDVGTLVGQARTNGLAITFEDTRPPGSTLPAPVELAAYRIVQESLTNALKHAAQGDVRIRLAQADGLLAVEITSPIGPTEGPRAPGSGAGLVGMRERAALLKGSFTAGPAPDAYGKIWRVRAELPVTEGESA